MENIILDNIPKQEITAEEKNNSIDYEKVLDAAMKIGIGLLSSGGSVSRVEIAVERICKAYGAEEVSCAAFPSMVIGSIKLASGHEYSLLKRVQSTSNNLALLEKYNQLSRDICSEKYPPDVALEKINELAHSKARNRWISILGAGSVGAIYSMFFGGTFADILPALIITTMMAGLNELLSTRSLNVYATVFILSFFGGLSSIALCKLLVLCGLQCHCSMVMIGTIMILIPGLMLTNAVRDLFTGDIMSGSFQIINALLLTVVIAAGYAVALLALKPITDFVPAPERLSTSWQYYVYFMGAGTAGTFAIAAFFNLNYKRLGWALLATVPALAVYLLMDFLLPGQTFVNVLVTALFAAIVSEFLARVIKTPATVFIVPSIIALVPGSALYFAMDALVGGNMALAGQNALTCILTLLGLAVGLCAATVVSRIITPVRFHFGKKKIKENFKGKK